MTYSFKCKNCNSEFEISSDFETIVTIHPNCPICYSNNVERKYGIFNIIFKGKGFYKTDNE